MSVNRDGAYESAVKHKEEAKMLTRPLFFMV